MLGSCVSLLISVFQQKLHVQMLGTKRTTKISQVHMFLVKDVLYPDQETTTATTTTTTTRYIRGNYTFR